MSFQEVGGGSLGEVLVLLVESVPGRQVAVLRLLEKFHLAAVVHGFNLPDNHNRP